MSDEIKPDIWQLQAQFDIQGLVKALSSDDPNIRRRAAAALRAVGAVEALVPLRAAFAAEEDPQTRLTIATTIEMLTTDPQREAQPESKMSEPAMQEALVKRLIEKLKTGKPDEIVEVAHRLGELGNKIAVEPLVLVFNDSRQSIQVRLAVAEALLKLESAPVEVALLANLRHADWHIRRNGAAILGQLRAEWAVQPLARALRDPHPVVRRTARAALKYIGTPESRKVLAQISVESTRRANAVAETVEGLEIKIPGHHEQEPERRSGMLSKHLSHDTERTGTKPLDPRVLEQAENRKVASDPTLSMTHDILRQAISEIEAEEASLQPPPKKSDTSEFKAVDDPENKPE